MKKFSCSYLFAASLLSLVSFSSGAHADFVPLREFEEFRNPASGDVVFSNQEFRRWNLICNELLSTGKKECSLMSKGTDDTFAYESVLAIGVDGKTYLNIAFITPDVIFRENGFFLEINGKQRFLTDKNVICINLDRMCTIQVEFDDEVRKAFVDEKPITGRFFIKTDRGDPLQRSFNLSMDNTNLAIRYYDQMLK